MTWEADLIAAQGIEDPVEQARVLSALLARHQQAGAELAALRRTAIDRAIASGVTRDQVAAALGVSGPRISQMRRDSSPAPEPQPVITGWPAGAGREPSARIAICGSRADGTVAEVIDQAIPVLADMLMRHVWAVTNGPVGVGSEVLTHIADSWHPDGLDHVPGIIGHPAVVRKADYVLVIGGGTGTQAEVTAALRAGSRLLPMPLAGGTAARLYYTRLMDEPQLRTWLADATFSQLASADAASFAAIAESVISGGTDA